MEKNAIVSGGGSERRGERGFVLAIVLVFTVVLSIALALTSRQTRINQQLVINKRNAAQALAAAEAGVAEATERLEMAKPTLVTVRGRTFDASIQEDPNDPKWQAYILFADMAPKTMGPRFHTPTILESAVELPYSAPAEGADALRIAWVLDGAGQIRKSKGRPVMRISSVGWIGTARRTVHVEVAREPYLSAIILNPILCPDTSLGGSSKFAVAGGLHINGTCPTALQLGNASHLTAGGPIDIVGGYDGKNITPKPNTGMPPMLDPLATLPVPPMTAPVRSGSALVPATYQPAQGTTLQPGIYYGGLSIRKPGIVMSPGVYIMAGGGFEVSSNGSVTGAGVMIYNTLDPVRPVGAGAFGQVLFTGKTVDLSAPTSGTYYGILIFQDRANTLPIHLQGGVSGKIDGLIYSANGALTTQGGPDILHSQVVIGNLNMQGGGGFNNPSAWLSLGKDPGMRQVAWADF